MTSGRRNKVDVRQPVKPVGARLVAGLTELRDTLRSKTAIESKFIVRRGPRHTPHT